MKYDKQTSSCFIDLASRGVSGIPNTAKAALLQQLTSKIRFSGPISVADYMKEVLTNPVGVCSFNCCAKYLKFF